MATSDHTQISLIIDVLKKSKPESVLDIGAGFGKYGVLAREYVEQWTVGKEYGDWKGKIDCIEPCEKYITSLHQFIYDNIFTEKAPEGLEKLQTYDLILCIDTLEHMPYEEGKKLIEGCLKKGKLTVISTPRDIGEGNDHWEVPEWGTHHFQWEEGHFDTFEDKTFLSNMSSLIVLLGEGAGEIGGKVKKNQWGETKWRLGQRFPLAKKVYQWFR